MQCPYCEFAAVPDTATFCPRCGARVRGVPSGQLTGIPLLIVFVAVCAVPGGCYVMLVGPIYLAPLAAERHTELWLALGLAGTALALGITGLLLRSKRPRVILSVLAGGAGCLALSIFVQGFGHVRPTREAPFTADVSRQGDKLAFTANGAGQSDLYIMDLKHHTTTRLTKTRDHEQYPCFTPDGRSIVYSAGVSNDRSDHLFMCSADGMRKMRLTDEDSGDEVPSFSPDGSRIVFTRGYEYIFGGLAAYEWTQWAACVMNADGTGVHRATTIKPRWSPLQRFWFAADGKSVMPQPSIPLAAMRQIQDVGVSTQEDQKPYWTSDGSHVLWCDRTNNLWMVNVKGTDLKQLADSTLFTDPLIWKPHV